MPSPGPSRRRVTIRHWPMVVASVMVAAMCVGGVYIMVAAMPAVWAAADPGRIVLGAGLVVATAALAVFSLANSRSRSIVDADGVTVVNALGRHRLDWATVTSWEVESGPGTWLIRVWSGDSSQVVARYRHILLPGLSSSARPRIYAEPPAGSPRTLQRAFAVMTAAWRAGR